MIEAARMFQVPPCDRLSERIEGFNIVRVWRLRFSHNLDIKQAQLPVAADFRAVGDYFVVDTLGLWRGIASQKAS